MPLQPVVSAAIALGVSGYLIRQCIGNIESGCVDVRQASVEKLPFAEGTFDVVTAVETHYYWPDRPAAMREILRVLKPGGTPMILAEVYRSGRFDGPARVVMRLLGGDCLTADAHRESFAQAGYTDCQVFPERRGWICATGGKPRA